MKEILRETTPSLAAQVAKLEAENRDLKRRYDAVLKGIVRLVIEKRVRLD